MKEINFDPNIYDTIRKNIRRYRLQKNITSSELADMVGLSHEFIRQIQSEKIAYNFSVDTLYRISVVLGVSLDDLIKKEDLENLAVIAELWKIVWSLYLANILFAKKRFKLK